ncbi:uncharacterized protein LAJ45_11136 [Morchella importuna]|uniref:uncharacterized protein n=1 Tax=Morchella importuna TaxID=1174673 RepID=UPI001E8EAAA5|nr:uncharacterized protein LAJ45_11136 [Morchella importuna]KAH8144866.1 hypothetical protein LAJ45_11136 [Morchella importuna]
MLLISMMMLGGLNINKEIQYLSHIVYYLLIRILVDSGYFHATPHEPWVQHTVWFLKSFRDAEAGFNQYDLAQKFTGMLINL